MSLLEIIRQVRRHLEESGRLSYRMLRREFALDDDTLAELIEELVDVQRIARREQDALAWAAAAPAVEREPRAYTPKHLADKILQSRSALEGERKQVTVLFADVKGSMELAEQTGPEAWHGILDRFFQILGDGVHRFEGTVNQYTGDGIMALFGAPIAHEDHAQRACYAALHLGEELRRYTEELKRTRGVVFGVRMGINSGEVIVGAIGDDLRMDYTAQGHTVGLAQRMEQLADPGKAYLTEDTARLVAGYFRLRDLGEFSVKGVGSPLHVHELEGAGALRTRLDRSRSRGLSRFVGRDDEVKTLEAALARAQEGHGQVVGIVADPGTGKSRLCFEFLERCRARGIAVNQAHAVSHGKGIPFLPILELFRDYFAITPEDGEQAAREKIAGRMLLLDETLRDSLPLVFDFLGVADPERPPAPLDAETRQRQLFAIIKRVAQARSRRAPALTLIEDLHWLDGGSEAIVELLVEATAGTRSLLLLNFRPEFHAAWMQRSSYQQLPLVPLAPEAIEALLLDLLGPDPSVRGLAATIHARTAGNPFFAEEVVQELIESGGLAGSKGAYRLVTPVETLAVPASVQAVLAARIDRLAEREKAVLQAAAVIGKEFSEPILRAALGATRELPPGELAAALAALGRAEFVYEQALYPVAEYAFKHPLTQEVAYGSQLGEPRARTHAAVARALEAERGALGEAAAVIAHHWESAGERVEAARAHDRAARWAVGTAPAEAMRHWQQVRGLLGEVETPELAALAVAVRSSLLATGAVVGLEDAEGAAIFEEGMRIARRFSDANAEADLVAMHGRYLVGRGAAADALKPVEEAVARARESGDLNLQLRALGTLAYTNLNLGRLRPALATSDQALALLESAPSAVDATTAGLLFSSRGTFLTIAGQLSAAAECFRRAQQLIPHLARAASWVALNRGDVQLASSLAAHDVDVAERTGIQFLVAMAHWTRGEAQNAAGAFEDALRSFEQALATGVALNLEGSFHAGSALAHLGLGDHERARIAVLHALELTRQRGHAIGECGARLTLARVLATIEGAPAAGAIEAALDEAERLIEETGAHLNGPTLHEERARLAGLRGDAAGRERELREAQRLYSEMGASGHVERLAQELTR
jgi:class 3 adenylate cyclase/tetratricopeptide (TPR) repeat protein